MNRIGTNDSKRFGVNGPQEYELTESELGGVWGGFDTFTITKTTDSSSPAFFRNVAASPTSP
jgi:hypothetical protein